MGTLRHTVVHLQSPSWPSESGRPLRPPHRGEAHPTMRTDGPTVVPHPTHAHRQGMAVAAGVGWPCWTVWGGTGQQGDREAQRAAHGQERREFRSDRGNAEQVGSGVSLCALEGSMRALAFLPSSTGPCAFAVRQQERLQGRQRKRAKDSDTKPWKEQANHSQKHAHLVEHAVAHPHVPTVLHLQCSSLRWLPWKSKSRKQRGQRKNKENTEHSCTREPNSCFNRCNES